MLLGNEEPSKSKETFLEKFCLLAKAATTTSSLLDVIRQALEAPNVFVFGELLAEPSVAQVGCEIPSLSNPLISYYPSSKTQRMPSTSRL